MREQSTLQVEMKKKEKEKEVFNPHDKGYKVDLSIPKEFLHFLKKYVKDEWTQDLTVDQLHLGTGRLLLRLTIFFRSMCRVIDYAVIFL